ncbi:MAG: thioesterase family protein [Syntrophobacterales bacterium]|nr:thioesterase family protein [Syntrophobacterales bacterium]
MLAVGMKHEKEITTGPEHSARNFFPDLPDVFGTPYLVGLFEGVSAELMAPHLSPGEQSVGAGMDLKHTAPTPLGMKVRAVTELVEVDKRKHVFRLEAFDEKEKIGEATHIRYIIDAAKFMQKVEAKKG